MEPAVADDPRQRRPDISKARLVLNWEPQVAMSEGLGRTVAYFRSLVEVAVPVAGIES
jgi:nucleoside-diphosphate-sugar epimerase